MSLSVKRLLIGLGTLILVLMFLPLMFPGRVPRRQVTRDRMAYDHFRILQYAHEHHALPPALSALPRLPLKPEADHYFDDGWGRRLQYKTNRAAEVTITSFGSDGAPGGTGEAMDIAFTFPTRNPDGTWIPAEHYDYQSYAPPGE